jgi:hypothetical protein
MAVTDITPTELVTDVMSADILDANGTVATTPADGFNILAEGIAGGRLLLKFLADASGDSVVIQSGDKPPAERAGLGDLTLVLAASDVRYVVVDPSRFMRDDGTILATCTDAGTSCKAFLLPK